jgi:hypothetical protein
MAISAYLVKALLHYSSEQGIDIAAVFKKFLIDSSLLNDEQTRIPIKTFNQTCLFPKSIFTAGISF